MNWYYAKNKDQLGPVSEVELEELVRNGVIQPDTLVWKEGMANWQPYSTTLSGAGSPVPGSQAVCHECGNTFERNGMIQHGTAWICAACKPAFLQKLSEGAAVNTEGFRYAGFWIRFAAKFIDGIIIGICVTAPGMAILAMMGAYNKDAPPEMAIVFAQVIFQIVSILASAAYSIFFVGKYGATPGKMACKIRIINEGGGKIGYGRATGRFFAEILSGLICYIGYIMVAFDAEKRALHDHICHTRVIYK